MVTGAHGDNGRPVRSPVEEVEDSVCGGATLLHRDSTVATVRDETFRTITVTMNHVQVRNIINYTFSFLFFFFFFCLSMQEITYCMCPY